MSDLGQSEREAQPTRATPIYHGEWFARLLNFVPMWLRSTPVLRRYFWQQWQVDAADERGATLFAELDW